MQEDSATFRQYLQTLPSELLACVTEDYIWLASLDFHEEAGRDADFRRRRECCREECSRRGVPQPPAAHYRRMLYMLEKSSVQVRNLASGRKSTAFR
jgi:hypothetical protein